MEIRTTARHFELTQELKDFVDKEINRLERYYDHIINSHLILEEEGYRKNAELNLKVYGTILTSQHSSNDFRTSIEGALEKMESQLKKYKSKLKERKFRERKRGKESTDLSSGTEEEEL
ncbi:MAG: ribosome-associated translation inhibitor RaiA [candidate division Zixibacteria bacterium]|nr:ribosome-associated translation inhibitor RaiA [candidate division Zixibacteria bacterium]